MSTEYSMKLIMSTTVPRSICRGSWQSERGSLKAKIIPTIVKINICYRLAEVIGEWDEPLLEL
jgi:hypothetical protein